jgi:tetratricopeptide (TPR) repeat protein
VTELRGAGREALQLASLDPVAARKICESVLELARRGRIWDVVSVTERALGVAAMTLYEVDDAIEHLRSAVAAGRRAGSRQVAGEARMSLASALLLRGLSAQAVRQIEAAVGELTGLSAARAHVQHAAILQELGRDAEAFDELRRALPVLRRSGDAEWEVRVYSNRSLMHVRARSFGAAEADLEAALRLCVAHRLDLPAGPAEHNLGYLKAQRGDVPAALRHFDAAAELYGRFGLVEPSLQLDRAGVLLSVRLLDEARAGCQAAVDAYRDAKLDVHLPDALLMMSTVALLQDDRETALASAREAVGAYKKLRHDRSLALARYAVIQAQVEIDRAGVSASRVARTADELEAAGWTVPALEARVLAGRMSLVQSHPATARQLLARASKARSVGPADARSRAWLAEALLRRADGRRAAAMSALRAGLRIVEDYQATLGATELRAHVSIHRGALATSGLRMAIEDGDARHALWWAERGRAIALLLRPAQPSSDPVLAQDLSDLRSTMAEIEEARSDGEGSDQKLVRRQVMLERRVRERCRTLEGDGSATGGRWGRESLSQLIEALGDAVLVEFVVLDGIMNAITVCGHRVRLHPLGAESEVRDLLRRLEFALHRLARPGPRDGARTAAAKADLARTADLLDDRLLRPLASILLQDRPLVVVPSGILQSLPWAILPSCVGRPVAVSPSATLWRQAAERPVPSTHRTVVVAGPGLPGATEEAEAVAALYPGATVLVGDEATTPRLRAALESTSMLHLAAHGRLRSDNPLFSSLVLADGPLTVYELEQVSSRPHHVVLAGCDTGRLQVVAGEETLGLGAAVLGGGTATLVAPVIPIPDLATVPLMRSYHEGLVAGLPPAAALAAAQAAVDPDDALSRAAAAGFICLGAGWPAGSAGAVPEPVRTAAAPSKSVPESVPTLTPV